MQKILWLEGMRGLLMIYIVLYHYTTRFVELFQSDTFNPNFALSLSDGGEVGVASFFMISGYLTMKSSNRIDLEGIKWIKKKYIRLWPQYIFSVIIIFIIVRYCGLPNREPTYIDLIRDLFMLPILSSKVEHAHWYVTALIGFYIIFFFLYKSKQIRNKWVYIFILLFNVISFTSQDNVFFHILSTYFFNAKIFLGVLMFLFIYDYSQLDIGSKLISFLYTIFFLFLNYKIVVIELLLLYLFSNSNSSLKNNIRISLSSKLFVFIGNYSFMWYLIHQNIGYIIINELFKMQCYSQIIPYFAALFTLLLAITIQTIYNGIFNRLKYCAREEYHSS